MYAADTITCSVNLTKERYLNSDSVSQIIQITALAQENHDPFCKIVAVFTLMALMAR